MRPNCAYHAFGRGAYGTPDTAHRERSELAHQRSYDVTVVYASLTGAAYPLHALHEVPLVVDLDVVGVQTHVHLHTYQAGGHRVRPAGHSDGTPLAQRRAVAGVFWHRSRRQRAQVWVLLRQLRET